MTALSDFLAGEPPPFHFHHRGKCPFRYHLGVGLAVGILLGTALGAVGLSYGFQQSIPQAATVRLECLPDAGPTPALLCRNREASMQQVAIRGH